MVEESEREIVTQEDVANHAGVSRAVVSYVVNNGPRGVSEKTRSRVLDAIQQLGYRPNKHAQRLRMGHDATRNSIGVIVGGKGYNVLERSYYSTMLARLFDSAHHLNLHIRFFSFFDAFKDPVFFNKNIHHEEISALLILVPVMIKHDPDSAPIVSDIKERIDTILCLEKSIYNLPALEIDLKHGACIAINHLIELGHKRIAYLSLDDERNHGYAQTLQTNGIPLDNSIIYKVDATNLYESAYELTGELLNAQPAITAIFCANDDIGIGAISRIQADGFRIPDDISVVSMDDSRIASIVHPTLTTVRLPFEYIGSHALEHLQALQANPDATPTSIPLPLELIVRQSSGIAKA